MKFAEIADLGASSLEALLHFCLQFKAFESDRALKRVVLTVDLARSEMIEILGMPVRSRDVCQPELNQPDLAVHRAHPNLKQRSKDNTAARDECGGTGHRGGGQHTFVGHL